MPNSSIVVRYRASRNLVACAVARRAGGTTPSLYYLRGELDEARAGEQRVPPARRRLLPELLVQIARHGPARRVRLGSPGRAGRQPR